MTPNALDMDVAQADYDALADLFLSDEPVGRGVPHAKLKLTSVPVAEPPTANGSSTAASNPSSAPLPDPRSPSSPSTLTIEGILAGHLPVLASAWVTQYARHLAESQHEPVALLRLVAGQAVLDLILPTGEKIPADISASPTEPLTSVIARLTPRFRHWLIRVDEPSESDLFSVTGITKVAILTGADDPAVVASFQAIKTLAHDLADRTPDLALVIMGSTDDRADNAESKLRRAAGQFLSRDLPTVRIPRITSSLAVQLYRAAATTPIAEVVQALKLPSPNEESRAPGLSDRRTPEAVARKPIPEPPTLASSHTTAAPSSPPQHLPTASSSRVGPIATADPILSQLHLTPLTITCPYAPSIRVAHDQQGRLHLLALTDLTPADGASRLLTAASWANDHAPLLAAAAPALRSATEPTLHVLTTDAKAVRTLLDTGLRLHVVTHLEVAGQTIPAVAALN